MTKHWTISGINYNNQLYSHDLKWKEKTIDFEFVNDDGQCVLISFPITVEKVIITHLNSTLSVNDDIFRLIEVAQCPVPTYPFFIQSNTHLIDEVVNEPYAFHGEKKFLQYTMITCDFWIDIISSVSPTVTVRQGRQGDGLA